MAENVYDRMRDKHKCSQNVSLFDAEPKVKVNLFAMRANQ